MTPDDATSEALTAGINPGLYGPCPSAILTRESQKSVSWSAAFPFWKTYAVLGRPIVIAAPQQFIPSSYQVPDPPADQTFRRIAARIGNLRSVGVRSLTNAYTAIPMPKKYADPHLTRRQAQNVRAPIQVRKLVTRLQRHADGEVEMGPGQFKAAQILLDKTLPTLSASELQQLESPKTREGLSLTS